MTTTDRTFTLQNGVTLTANLVLTAREILEQAVSHFEDKKTYPMPGGGTYEVNGWTRDEWFSHDEGSGVEITQACSAGAMLLAVKMAGIEDLPGDPFERYFRLDPEFAKAVLLLHAAIKERWTGWHYEDIWSSYLYSAVVGPRDVHCEHGNQGNVGCPQEWSDCPSWTQVTEVKSWIPERMAWMREEANTDFALNQIVRWNDDEGREYEEVLDVFNNAIKRAIEAE